MAEPHDALDQRLRSALGPDSPLRGPRTEAGLGAARQRMLRGVRHRRARRLQALTAGAVVALALAVVLPQTLGGGPASRRPASASGPSGQPTSPVSGSSANRSVEPVGGSAECHVGGQPASVACGSTSSPPGSTSAGPTSQPASPTAGATGSGSSGAAAGSASAGTEPPTQPGVEPGVTGRLRLLVVTVGRSVTVALPNPPAGDQWGSVNVVSSTPGAGGQVPVVTVQQSGAGAHGAIPGSRFVILAVHPGSALVEVDAGTHCGARPAHCVVSWTWQLDVEVKT